MLARLLGLRLEHVLESLQEDRGLLELIPEPEQQPDRGVGEQHQRVDGDELTDRQFAGGDEQRADPQEQDEQQEAGELDRCTVEHQDPVAAEHAVGERGEFLLDPATEPLLGAGALGRLDALDRVELLGGVTPVGLFEAVERRSQAARGVAQQAGVDRGRGKEHSADDR